ERLVAWRGCSGVEARRRRMTDRGNEENGCRDSQLGKSLPQVSSHGEVRRGQRVVDGQIGARMSLDRVIVVKTNQWCLRCALKGFLPCNGAAKWRPFFGPRRSETAPGFPRKPHRVPQGRHYGVPHAVGATERQRPEQLLRRGIERSHASVFVTPDVSSAHAFVRAPAR